MGGLLLSSHPAPVRAAIDEHRRRLDENPVHYLREAGPPLESAVLAEASAYLGVGRTEIALTDSTTQGLGLLYNGISIRSDQEILTTTHDYYATHESLRLKSAASGASVRQVSLYGQPRSASVDEIVGNLARSLTERTRVVAVTWVHSSTGVKLPIREIADVVAGANAGRDAADRALLCVDAVHGLGVEEESPAQLRCDFFVAGCHKWLFGPRGTGVVWGKADAWPHVRPTVPTFSDSSSYGGLMTPGGFHSFEHRWALAQAFEFHRAIGKARVAARIHGLSQQLKDGLAEMQHIVVHTPADPTLSAGLVCFEVAGLGPDAVVDRLRQRGIIATVTPYATRYARLASGLLNTPEEVEVTLGALWELR